MDNFSPNLDKQADKPLYYQLYNYILDELKRGNLRGGERLPSKRSLSENLGISRNTVETAYQMLVSEGFIESRERSGYFVSQLEPIITEERSGNKGPELETKTKWHYDLGTGTVDTGSFPVKIWNRLYRDTLTGADLLLNLGDRQGEQILREEISKYLYAYRGVSCSPEQIVIGAGFEYLLTLLTDLFEDKAFALEDPGYNKILDIIRNQGKETKFIPLDEHGLSVSHLEESEADIVYLTPSHQFPTGIQMPAGRRLQILRWANRGNGRYIIEDDYDSEFRFDRFPVSSLQGLDSNERVIYMSTFSRSLAPSIRIAYMVLPKPLLPKFHERFEMYNSTVSRFDQIALANFMLQGHYTRHLNRIKKIYKERRDRLIAALRNSFGERIEISGEHTGIHLLLTLNTSQKEEELIKKAKKAGIRLSGLRKFYHQNSPVDKRPGIVLGYGDLEVEKTEKVIQLLERIWKEDELD